MKVYIKQKIFSIGDKFTVKNEYDEPVISVVGKVFSLGNKLHIYDRNQNEIFYVEQALFRFLPEYKIYQNGMQVAFLKKEFTLFNSKINITSSFGDFRIEGDIFSYNFNLYQSNELVGVVSKKILSFTDSYVLDVIKTANIEFLVTLVIVIDQILHDRDNKK